MQLLAPSAIGMCGMAMAAKSRAAVSVSWGWRLHADR